MTLTNFMKIAYKHSFEVMTCFRSPGIKKHDTSETQSEKLQF